MKFSEPAFQLLGNADRQDDYDEISPPLGGTVALFHLNYTPPPQVYSFCKYLLPFTKFYQNFLAYKLNRINSNCAADRTAKHL